MHHRLLFTDHHKRLSMSGLVPIPAPEPDMPQNFPPPSSTRWCPYTDGRSHLHLLQHEQCFQHYP